MVNAKLYVKPERNFGTEIEIAFVALKYVKNLNLSYVARSISDAIIKYPHKTL